ILGKIRPIFQAEPVSSCRNIFARRSRLIQQRVLILYVIGFESGPTVVVLSIFDVGIKANGHPSPPTIIEPKSALDLVCDWKGHLSEKRRSPRTQIGWVDCKSEGVIQ